MDCRPIGVFDSGLGGISVLKEARRLLPNENFIYYGDNKNAPYGDRPWHEIFELSFACADFLVSMNVKVLLLACNTATGAAIRDIRSRLSIPVVSIEPAIKPACETEGSGRILMLATTATTKLERYIKLQARMADPSRVINVPCPGLVEIIESGSFNPEAYEAVLNRHLSRFMGERIDGIVLGCTHYVFIRDVIAAYAARHFAGECRLFDGNEGTARQLGRVLAATGLENPSGTGHIDFYTSGDIGSIMPLFELLMQR